MTTGSGFVEELCRSHEVQLLKYLTHMLGNRETAREVAQDAFAKLHATYPPDTVRLPKSLLFTVATNFALMRLRRQRLERRVIGVEADAEHLDEVPDHDVMPADRQVMTEQLGRYLAEVIKGLRPNLRIVFVMAHVEGRPRREIAAVLGVSEKRIDKRMTKALKECRERLSSLGIGPA